MDTPIRFARRYPVTTGYLLIFLATWSIDLTLVAQTLGWLPPLLPAWMGLLVAVGFVVAAIVATALVEGRAGVGALLRRFLIWRVGLHWYGVALLLPPIVVLVALGLAMLFAGSSPDFNQPFVRRLVSKELVGSLWVVAATWLPFEILTNGEEIGWRGYILPRLLARHNALVASLFLGVAWALWHLPKFWMGGPSEMAHSYPFWVFAVDILAQTVLITWLFLNTRGSLWLATLYHAAHNTAYLCLPIGTAVPDGEVAFYIAIGLRWLLVVCLVAVQGTGLVGRRTSTGIAPTGINPIGPG